MKSDDEVAAQVVDAAVAIHMALGPGLLEPAYVAALRIEFDERALACEREVPIHVNSPLMKDGTRRIVNGY